MKAKILLQPGNFLIISLKETINNKSTFDPFFFRLEAVCFWSGLAAQVNQGAQQRRCVDCDGGHQECPLGRRRFSVVVEPVGAAASRLNNTRRSRFGEKTTYE